MYWPRLATALAIALHVWGPTPCGPVGVAYAEPPFPNYEAWTDPATCTIYLSREDAARFRVEPEFRCAVIVHEWGHMNGRQHSPDPKNVMYANVTNYWRCQRPAERHVTLMVGDPATGLVFY